jgi:hypothetical protein
MGCLLRAVVAVSSTFNSFVCELANEKFEIKESAELQFCDAESDEISRENSCNKWEYVDEVFDRTLRLLFEEEEDISLSGLFLGIFYFGKE